MFKNDINVKDVSKCTDVCILQFYKVLHPFIIAIIQHWITMAGNDS